MNDFSDPSFAGSGRRRPEGRPRLKTGKDSLKHLNFAKGTRIRVLEDNGRKGLVGLEGVVVASVPGSVVVELEDDPLVQLRMNMSGGIAFHSKQPQRHFRVTEVERVPDPRAP